jgi:two-component system, LytTR family, sensor kinase
MKQKLNNKPLLRFYLWVAVAYFLLGVFGITGYFPGKFFYVVLNNLWAIGYVTVFNFILFEYTVPFVFSRKRPVIRSIFLGTLLFGAHLLFYTYVSYGWRLLGEQVHVYTFLQTYPTLSGHLGFQLTYNLISVFFFGVGRHIYGYVRLKESTQQLLIEKHEAELNFLKSQTNPHFLFNTLNNIFSLSRDKSDLAPESIIKLSKILRFMLYETGGRYIALEQEVKIISDYIDLEKLRYDESLRVNFNYDVDDMKQPIPPLLLIPLVENAFKHGVSETTGDPFIDIHLSAKCQQVNFVIKNSSESSSSDPPMKKNIGLGNLRRQLELLYEDYNLSTKRENATFIARLTINLASRMKAQLNHS